MRLAESWRDILRQHAATVDGIGIGGTLDWTLSLWENHLHSRPAKVFVLEDEGQVCAVLPCHQEVGKGSGLREIVLGPISNLCSGRVGFLVRDGLLRYLDAIFEFLYTQLPGWDVFHCQLVDGSPSAKIFHSVVEKHRYPIAVLDRSVSPYIHLPAQRESYFTGLPKNFRENLKKSAKRLNKTGMLAVRFYESSEEVAEFIEIALGIERRSWKERVGSSITTNSIQEGLYRRFLPRAAENGWLMSTVLSVDGVPLAYAMGFIFENIYYNEKASFDDSMRSTGAGTYIYSHIIDELYRRGVRDFDFMGKCEEFKMRWTDLTYSRTTYVLYNRGIRSTLLRARHNIAQTFSRARPSSTDENFAHLRLQEPG